MSPYVAYQGSLKDLREQQQQLVTLFSRLDAAVPSSRVPGHKPSWLSQHNSNHLHREIRLDRKGIRILGDYESSPGS